MRDAEFGYYYEEFRAATGRWTPVRVAEKPTLKGDRIQRNSNVGPRIRCLQPRRMGYLFPTLAVMQELYGPASPRAMALEANRREGLVDLDVERDAP